MKIKFVLIIHFYLDKALVETNIIKKNLKIIPTFLLKIILIFIVFYLIIIEFQSNEK